MAIFKKDLITTQVHFCSNLECGMLRDHEGVCKSRKELETENYQSLRDYEDSMRIEDD